jgi:hypothetical protein
MSLLRYRVELSQTERAGSVRRAIPCRMAKPNPDSPTAQAQAFIIPARLLLFCVASRTGWERAGISRATVTATVVRGLIERDVAGGLTITKRGRAVLAALLMEEDE